MYRVQHIIPASSCTLKNSVNKWGERRTLSKDKNRSKKYQNNNNRQEPKLFINSHEIPKLSYNFKF